jgi:hypothetical protein
MGKTNMYDEHKMVMKSFDKKLLLQRRRLLGTIPIFFFF